jgi:hypothetical protein
MLVENFLTIRNLLLTLIDNFRIILKKQISCEEASYYIMSLYSEMMNFLIYSRMRIM